MANLTSSAQWAIIAHKETRIAPLMSTGINQHSSAPAIKRKMTAGADKAV